MPAERWADGRARWCAHAGAGVWLRCVLQPARGAALYRAGEPTAAFLEAIGEDAIRCPRGATLEAIIERGDVADVVAVVRHLLALTTKGLVVTIRSSVLLYDDGAEGAVAWHGRPYDADGFVPWRAREAFAMAAPDRKAARSATVPRSVPRSSVSLGGTAFRRVPRRTSTTRVPRREAAPWS